MTRQALRRDADLMDGYGPGSNIVKFAADVLRLPGHNMPPEELGEAAQ
jgi:methylmalonyl-CoA mutase